MANCRFYSPLGQAIFLGKNTSYNASAGAPPLIGSSEQGYITGFDGANLMVDLGAYWQNRGIASGPGNITGSTETGTAAGNPLEVQVMAASSATSDNTGGLPSDPALYATVGDPSALQSIATLNITNTPTLDLLLAALIDNTTGGANAVNGTLESVTYQVGFLGLNGGVRNAISNAIDPNDGLYGAPASHFPPPPPPSGWAAFWNAVTSFVTNPLGAVLSLVDTVWNAATAAFTYLNHLAHEAAAIGAEVVARTAAAIVQVGQIIASALNQLLSYLLQLVTELLKTVVQPISSAMKAYVRGVESAIGHAQNDTTANGSLGAGDASAVWTALSGPVFLFALGFSAVVVVALTILSSIDIGPSFVVDLVISLVVGTLIGLATQKLLNSVGTSFSSVSSRAVYALEDFFNGTNGPSNQSAWTTVAFIISTCFEFQMAFALDLFALLGDTRSQTGVAQAVIGGTISLAFDIAGIVLLVAGLAGHVSIALLILGEVIGIYSVVAALGARKVAQEAVPPTPELVTLMNFDIVLQLINLGSTTYALTQSA